MAALFWSGNFIIGKFATLFEIPPLSLNTLRWISVWIILIPFTYKEIIKNFSYIKKNILILGLMGVLSISTFNSVVYFALNYTQVINAVLVLAAIPAATIVISSIMKVDKTNHFQIFGLILSIFGIGFIVSNGEIERIISLSFNKGDLWMLVCVLSWSLFSTLLKKYKFKFSQFTLLHLMVSIGILFLIPQYYYESLNEFKINYNKAFLLILFYVVIFPAIAAYYCWQKGVSILGPNKATMFIQLMPLFSVAMAITIFDEKFAFYHFAGTAFIVTGIYLSNKRIND